MDRAQRGLRAVATVTSPTRCAIYTRVSTEDQASKEYSSLDAQREMAAAYITSQRHEGWVAIEDRYDDPGYSGATTKRPALQRLLADIEAGQVDCVVAYRYDRVSRSLLDFLQLLEFLKKHQVGFVSIAERFDTSTPHGEMALNMVLSVAQCERRIIGQRTRDKIHAARRRGRWTGGTPVLGYDTAPEGGRLLVNEGEAEQVRAIFQLFVEVASLIPVSQELNRRGWTTKARKPWTRVTLRTMLTNPLYIGRQKLGAETFPGEHDAVVPRKLFDQVQRLLANSRSTGSAGARNGHGFLLRGLIRCAACDAAMTPGWSRSRARLYKYYRCVHAEKNGHAVCPTKSVKADKVEAFVVGEIKRIGADPALQQAVFEQALAQVKAQRRGIKAEAKRLERELVTAHADVERLVGAVSRVTGPAADAIAAELAREQERVGTLESRQREVEAEIAALGKQDIDREAVASALQAWDELWSVLLVPERERVLKLLVDRIDYGGGTLQIQWRLAGFGQLASEVAP